jgi:3-keto-disaccharide hydrolase
MRKLVLVGIVAAAQLVGATMASRLSAETASFETDAVGGPPRGWLLTMTGKGAPRWTVERDEGGGAVLKQSGKATYPLAFKEGTSIRDGFVEVKFKPISGSEDRAGGIVWRAKDANNYYVVRANALEDNVVLYKTVNGARSSLDIVGQKGGYGVKTAVPANQWHTLRVEFEGPRFSVIFNGKPLFQVQDATFPDAGMIGLWTKADSVTAFSSVAYQQK